jgi:hypothetical protein
LVCFGFSLSDLFGFARRRTVEIHVYILERAEQSSSSEDHLHGAMSYRQEVVRLSPMMVRIITPISYAIVQLLAVFSHF